MNRSRSLPTAFFFLLSPLLFIASILLAPRPAMALDASELLSYFMDELSPYGRWSDQAPYGRVWEPRGVSADWKPYSDGRWTYSDDYGWVWQPAEEWGDVTYHYGRWWRHDGRWMWVPDDTWGPAWVDWREGDDYIGWAPLPPDADWRWHDEWRPSEYDYSPSDYVFVPRDHFVSSSNIRQYVVPTRRNEDLLRRGRPVTVYRTVHDRVYDEGPRRDAIERRLGHPIARSDYHPHAPHGRALPVPAERHALRENAPDARASLRPEHHAPAVRVQNDIVTQTRRRGAEESRRREAERQRRIEEARHSEPHASVGQHDRQNPAEMQRHASSPQSSHVETERHAPVRHEHDIQHRPPQAEPHGRHSAPEHEGAVHRTDPHSGAAHGAPAGRVTAPSHGASHAHQHGESAQQAHSDNR